MRDVASRGTGKFLSGEVLKSTHGCGTVRPRSIGSNPTAEPDAVDRGVLSADGTFIARFSAGGGVVLDSAASAYTWIDRRGVSTTHRCQFAMGGHLSRLSHALDLFNSCVDRPFLCRELEDRLRSPSVFQTAEATVLRYARWVLDARTQQRTDDGTLIWTSEDGIAQLELPSHRRFFRVTLPVGIPTDTGLAPCLWLRPDTTYMKRVTQVFSATGCPARWRKLWEAARCDKLPEQKAGGGVWTVELPQAAVLGARHPSTSLEVAPLQRFLAGISALPHSRHNAPSPTKLWLGAETVLAYQPSMAEVEVVLPDGGALVSSRSGAFFTYFAPGGSADDDGWFFATGATQGVLAPLGPTTSAAIAQVYSISHSAFEVLPVGGCILTGAWFIVQVTDAARALIEEAEAARSVLLTEPAIEPVFSRLHTGTGRSVASGRGGYGALAGTTRDLADALSQHGGTATGGSNVNWPVGAWKVEMLRTRRQEVERCEVTEGAAQGRSLLQKVVRHDVHFW